jgi:hypothetical protein
MFNEWSGDFPVVRTVSSCIPGTPHPAEATVFAVDNRFRYTCFQKIQQERNPAFGFKIR